MYCGLNLTVFHKFYSKFKMMASSSFYNLLKVLKIVLSRANIFEYFHVPYSIFLKKWIYLTFHQIDTYTRI